MEYMYIVQASLEPSRCKIGRTDDLERRLKEYNAMTGKSKNNVYQYLFAGEVKDAGQVEKAVKEKYPHLREEKSREIYFYNAVLFKDYVAFIKAHKLFVKEIIFKSEDKIVKIVKKTTPSLEERSISRKDVLQKAQKVKNDEFYTRYEDVEKEIRMYDKSIWQDKIIFCNCDDPVDNDEKRTSAFGLYFLRNFEELKVKKLICTHYGGGIDLFNAGGKGYIFTKEGFDEGKQFPSGYSGSFDDPLSLQILRDEADIVCTNPPFSRAIHFWKTIIESGKKFLIISNITNVINTAYIPYFKEGKVWTGYNRIDWFLDSKRQLVDAAGHWYTNLAVKNRPKYKNLKILKLKEIPEKYKKYDDNKILLVDNCYIPEDYKKPFAVSARPILNGLLEKGYTIMQEKRYTPYINGKECFARILVQKTCRQS
ncbi:MAG: GIY-YIG nuclease family protein [Spirochaetaceae bacterium]|jgi:predicted GIY-YIG superfamily endonuclease|nr:GIY-YIG nuclease family protein [Spirochaetaceae bacterium]